MIDGGKMRQTKQAEGGAYEDNTCTSSPTWLFHRDGGKAHQTTQTKQAFPCVRLLAGSLSSAMQRTSVMRDD